MNGVYNCSKRGGSHFIILKETGEGGVDIEHESDEERKNCGRCSGGSAVLL